MYLHIQEHTDIPAQSETHTYVSTHTGTHSSEMIPADPPVHLTGLCAHCVYEMDSGLREHD